MAELSTTSMLRIGAAPELAPCEVHLWRMNLGVSVPEMASLNEILSPEEQARAERYYFEKHRNRFIAGRIFLRRVLAGYLQVDPEQLTFATGPAGKPSLRGAPAPLEFNLSHSEDQALLAVTRMGPVGVDIERVRPIDDAAALVNRFFSRREAGIFNRLPSELQPRAFFNLWTRKEALLKATGEGIAHSLRLVEVSFLPGEPARVLALPKAFRDAADWRLETVEVAAGYTAALAIGACGKPVQFLDAGWPNLTDGLGEEVQGL